MDDGTIPINGSAPPPPPEDPPVVILGDRYAKALLGCTISAAEPSRACYSLPVLEECEGPADGARDRVLRLIHAVTTKHGQRAPVFVDDTIARKEKSRIVRPGGWRPRRDGGPSSGRRC